MAVARTAYALHLGAFMTLKLKNETIRVLSNNDLGTVIGGASTYSVAPADPHRDDRAPRGQDLGKLSNDFANESSARPQ